MGLWEEASNMLVVFFSVLAISWEGSTDVLQRTPIKFKDAKLLGWL